MPKRLIAAALALLLVGLGAGWYFLSPGWTVKQMVSAAKAGDVPRLSSYVDYPALKADMKQDVTARMKSEAEKDKSPAAQMSLAMGLAMVGPIVDAMMAPESLKKAFARLDKSAAADLKGKASAAANLEPVITRQSVSRFVVGTKESPGSGLVFERRGLGWKLTGIDLPPNPSTRTP